jgi:hypothetical protein
MINMDFISKLSKKEKVGLAAAAIVVSVVMIDRLVVSPIGERFQRLGREIELSEKKLVLDLRNISNKELISGEYDKYRNYVKRSASSDEEEVAAVLAEIEGLARRSDINLADIKPQQAKQTDFYREYYVEIEAEGAMEHIIVFLHNLNSSPQLLRAVKLRMGLKDRESSIVKASIMVSNISI